MNIKLSLPVLALGTILLSGCGGGSSASGEPTTGPINSFGPIETRGQITGAPIVRDLGTISTVALAGVLTDATYRPQGRQDNETAIAIGNAGALDILLESGESVDSWRPVQSNPEDYYVYPVWSPDASRLYYATPTGIYYTTPANPTVATPVIPLASGLLYFSLSPSGTRIAYTRVPVGEDDPEVFVRDVAGGATKRVTTNTVSDTNGTWLDDNRLFIQTSGETPTNRLVRYSDLTSTPYDSAVTSVVIARSLDGTLFLNSGSMSETAGFSTTQKATSIYQTKDHFTVDYGNLGGASPSPDGTRWAVQSTKAGVFTTELAPVTPKSVVGARPIQAGVSWQSAMGITKFLGSGGKLGTSSAGLIATRRTGAGRNGLSSFVTWDCETRSTSTVSDDLTDPDAGSKTYTIEADRLTALKYANRPFFGAVSVVSASGTANGAVVNVDGKSGVVTAIIVFQETRGAKPTIRREGDRKVIEGAILSVWNAKGANVAPEGTTRVTLPLHGEPEIR
ncbi:hypothetical protein EON81_04705 [bacterium]|nr:MAG: hypothetical protein EON81_04705 [bacterium]